MSLSKLPIALNSIGTPVETRDLDMGMAAPSLMPLGYSYQLNCDILRVNAS